MNLRELIGSYKTLEIEGSLDLDILGIQHDSRLVDKGYLFIAKKGFREDGHKYIQEAIDRGAIGIVLSHEGSPSKDVTRIRVEDTDDATGYLASRFYDYPQNKLDLIGITGTNGKTSTSYFIRSILENSNIKTGLVGTTGALMDEKVLDLNNTTPEPLELIRSLKSMVDNKMTACVMEVSSHALDLNRVEYLDYQIGIFTNLTKDHLDYHKTMEEYFKAKRRLFYKTRAYNIINIDDEYGRQLINSIPGEIISFGIENIADIFASEITYSIDKVKFKLNYKKTDVEINLNVPGRFSIYNALAAAACAIALNIELDIIKKGLESIQGVEGRFEVVPTNKDYTVIIDFAHTADGLENVLTILDQFAEGRKIVVFGAGGNRDKTKRPEMGEVVGNHADFALVTSDNPRLEDPKGIIEDILVGIKRTTIDYRTIEDRKEAIEYALSIARPKDIILLAGKGHERYILKDNKKYPFDERKIVLDYLRG